jgi:hypothetical protein
MVPVVPVLFAFPARRSCPACDAERTPACLPSPGTRRAAQHLSGFLRPTRSGVSRCCRTPFPSAGRSLPLLTIADDRGPPELADACVATLPGH